MIDLASLTLRRFFDRRRSRGFLDDADPRTVNEYRFTLRKWERLTPDPPLGAIGREALEDFRSRLLAPPAAPSQAPPLLFPELHRPEASGSLSPATVNKHLRHVRHLLAEAADCEAIERVPKVRYCRTRRKRPRDVREADLSAIYRACSTALYPRLPGLDPGNWWKALLCTACVEGFRRGGLLGLRWDGIDWESMEIRLPAESDKCGQERLKPMSRLVAQHLLRIRGDWELVFPWPHSERTFYRCWHAIQLAAGIAAERQYKIHDLKRTCATLYAIQGAPSIALTQLLDHTGVAMSERYINDARAADSTREAVEKLRLPAAFSAEFPPASTAAG